MKEPQRAQATRRRCSRSPPTPPRPEPTTGGLTGTVPPGEWSHWEPGPRPLRVTEVMDLSASDFGFPLHNPPTPSANARLPSLPLQPEMPPTTRDTSQNGWGTEFMVKLELPQQGDWAWGTWSMGKCVLMGALGSSSQPRAPVLLFWKERGDNPS